MKNFYNFGAKPVKRYLTIADIQAAKGKRKLTQSTAFSVGEARAVADAGIDMMVGSAEMLPVMREGAPHTFITAGVFMTRFISPDEVLRQAYSLLEQGADAIYMPREPRIIEHLAKAYVPVMTHLGLVPRISTWIGGLRAVGTRADEAVALYQSVKDAENAGAVLAELEVVAAEVVAAIAPRTSISIVSLGSGAGGDIDYLFQEDICGTAEITPRHARAFADLRSMYAKIDEARRDALRAFKTACESGSYPDEHNTVSMKPGEEEKFLAALDKL